MFRSEAAAHRQFYEFQPGSPTSQAVDIHEQKKREDLFSFVSSNIIGSDTVFASPFGNRRVTYCDYTASGRSLKFIEDYIQEQVLPQYGSTHTTTTVSSLQTSLFRHEARGILRNAVRASEHDRIIFAGSGATSAINRLIHGLKLAAPPIVFVDFTAHHSSFLPWREIGAMVLRVKEDEDGNLDVEHLEFLLKRHLDAKRQLIGCFTAASNITGVILDENAITILLHKYGALAFWDYATAAPYTDVTMDPHLCDDSESLARKDALFFSLHKFIGGVQTPGVLVARKELFKNEVPFEPGGGTVFFVSRASHRYLKDVEEREEGGTPPIVETIRGGMVMQLKMSLSPDAIMKRCQQLSEQIRDFLSSAPELVPLGNVSSSNRLPILSFLVKHRQSGKYLHYNYVSALLNDLFGVQSRGGCACAGPYAQDLLGIDEALAERFEQLLIEDPTLDRSHLRRKEEHSNLEVLRPGFVRINLPFTASDEQIAFIFSALKIVCKEGWKLLPQYIFNPETGEWKHHTNLVFKNRQWLQNISYSKGFFETNLKAGPKSAPSYEEVLLESENVLKDAEKVSQRMKLPDQSILFRGKASTLCWFLHPSEAQSYLKIPKTEDQEALSLTVPPFTPQVYPLNAEVLKRRPEFVWQTEAKFLSNAMSNLELVRSKEIRPESSQNDQILSDIICDTICSRPTKLVEVNEICDTILASDINICKNNVNSSEDKALEMNSKKDKALNICENGVCSIRTLLKDTPENGVAVGIPLHPKSLWVTPPKRIFNPTLEAVQAFNMIHTHDKVLVCLSGGKDSLSLLHTLRQYQFYAKSKGIPFTLGAVTVDPQSSSYDPSPLIPYLRTLNVPYFYEKQGILQQALEVEDLNSICSFCSRMKRGRIYSAARREGFNVLALGQHLDDLTESFLMSVFHNGRLRTMKAAYSVKEGDLRVIRPFVYVREKELRQFAESSKLPIIPENCPGCFESPKERHRIKQLLAQQEVLFPRLFWSLKTALYPILAIDKTGVENNLFGKKTVMCSEDDDEE